MLAESTVDGIIILTIMTLTPARLSLMHHEFLCSCSCRCGCNGDVRNLRRKTAHSVASSSSFDNSQIHELERDDRNCNNLLLWLLFATMPFFDYAWAVFVMSTA